MIITLFLANKLYKFRLPSQVSGSYSFDYEDHSAKLINVEAREGRWVLYKTSDVDIVSNGMSIENVELLPNNFYFLKRDNISYVIYVSAIEAQNLLAYTFETLNLTIGYDENCNIRYGCPYIKDSIIKITASGKNMYLEKNTNIIVYVNEEAIKTPKVLLNSGDAIEIYGLKLMIINNTILINNIKNKLAIRTDNSGMSAIMLPEMDSPLDVEIKDVDLYSSDDYYSKSPRMRRLIEDKQINLTAPPNTAQAQELPLILTIGPMATMALMSGMTLINVLNNVMTKRVALRDCWPQLITCSAMMISMLLWPTIIRLYNKKQQEKRRKEIIEKYNKYLNTKRETLNEEVKEEGVILNENLLPLDDCLNIIEHRSLNFWDKRPDQNDFLTARIGIGNELLRANITYNEEDFSIDENDLRKKADELKEEYKYIKNVPIGYSFFEGKTTAVMGKGNKATAFINNVILQFLTFYSYEDVKFVVFTNKKNDSKFSYLKYLNHNFSNDKLVRFYSTNYENSKVVADYLNFEINNRLFQLNNGNTPLLSPHYFIIVDGYENVKRYDFVRTLTEIDTNLGMNIVFIENTLSKLPSKCDNFIILGDGKSQILKNSYEQQQKVEFTDEIKYDIDMARVTKQLANIPIEIAESYMEMPDVVSFLEMEQVGKIEQLNIFNRWSMNDSTQSLRAEVGVDERGDLMYLDVHEKFHGPHGLIAGITGSGKSEFIITYILSMAINYSPDDVSFILIDYKGGGLAFAFENKATGVSLPHLAGTITNLDKAEMDRTLVSIDSEIKRRQEKFNEAKNITGESTMDIYKYQRYYKDGILSDPIPHLLIICDEFAELKDSQPDFMDNLISVARIGRSLGVHLILATQKPSGVVNDQIWSNSRFRVCLKVQDEADSKEMLKKPDAAAIRQTGRFYLQVGYDEYYALGQSAWAGAKYYPSEKVLKQVDKSINFIDESGSIIKSIQSQNGPKIEAQGEQLSSILQNIIEISTMVNKRSKRLWLDNIPEIILVDNLKNKYGLKHIRYNPTAIIGEYDAPQMQQQGLVQYDFLKNGNTIIYGVNGLEKEKMLNTIIYSSVLEYSVKELNYYIIDYGSETLRIYNNLPQIGGMVFSTDEEKYNNLIKLIKQEIKERKKLFADYGGEYKSYIANSGKPLPVKAIIINNYDSLYEARQSIFEELPELTRDSERYGIIFIVTANTPNSIHTKLKQNFKNTYALKLKDSSDYSAVFDQMIKIEPRSIDGRGLLKINNQVFEFQTASIVQDKTKLNSYLANFVNNQKLLNYNKAGKIPVLPDFIRYNDIKEHIKGLGNIPVAITKDDLEVVSMDFLSNTGSIIASNRLQNTESFVNSLIYEFTSSSINTIIIDTEKTLNCSKYPNYFNSNFDNVLTNINNFLQKQINTNAKNEWVIVIYGINKLLATITDKNKFIKLTDLIKKYSNISLILVDAASRIKEVAFETWYPKLFTTNDGIWIGRGVSDQNIIRISSVSKEMTKDYANNQGYVISEGLPKLVQYIDFFTEGDIDEK